MSNVKRTLGCVLLALVMALGLAVILAPGNVVAAADVPEGLKYSIGATTVTITGYGGSNADLVIPDTIAGKPVTAIQDGAVMGNSKIKTLVLPAHLTYLGMYAFANCDNLTTVTVPSSLIEAGQDPFLNCSKLEYTIFETGKYLGNADNPYVLLIGLESNTASRLELPATTTAVAEFAFSQKTRLNEVVFPEGVVCIPRGAFNGCSGLRTVVLPEGVKTIDEQAFYNSGLTNITLPESVTYIGRYAFYSCNLAKINIPAAVTYIGAAAFEGNGGMSGVYITDLAAWCRISLGSASTQGGTMNPLFYAKKLYLNNQLITDLVIPEGVECVGAYAFSGGNFKSIVIPADTAVQAFAFAGCTQLESLTIPSIQGNLGNYFSKNKKDGGLELKQLDYASDTILTKEVTYYVPWNLHTVKVNGNSIGAGAFHNWSTLTTLYIGDRIKSVGYGAVHECPNLDTVYVENPSNWAGCEIAATYFELSHPLKAAKNTYFLDKNGQEMTQIQLDNSVTAIVSGAFWNAKHITSVVIPKSVKTIGTDVFHGCKALQSLDLPFIGASRKTHTTAGQYPLGYLFGKEEYEGGYKVKQYFYYTSINSLTSEEYWIPNSLTTVVTTGEILPYAFCGCSSLKSIQYPQELTQLGEHAFDGCSGLETIQIPAGLKEIEAGLLSGCKTLKQVAIPAGVTHIYNTAFYGCTGLQQIYLPANLSYLGDTAFMGCSSITTIVIPEKVTRIPVGIFRDCSNLQTVAFLGNITELDAYAFAGCTKLKEINLPDGISEIGDYAFTGCYSLTEIKMPADLDTIGFFAFDGCIALKEIKLPEGSRVIGPSAFRGCSALKDVGLPNSLTNIDNSAFWGCSSLEYIYLPPKLAAIQEKTFADCVKLKAIAISEDVLVIKEDAFSGCINLESIAIQTNLQSVYKEAFLGCTKLKNVYYSGSADQWSKISIRTGNTPLTNAARTIRHTHQYAENKSAARTATCTQLGYRLYTCKCGAQRKDYTERVAHKITVTAGVEPTCLTPGKIQSSKCSVCKRTVLIGMEIPALGHSWGIYISNDDATPEANGTETATCLRSGCGMQNTRIDEDSMLIVESIEMSTLPKTLSYFAKKDPLDATGGVIKVYCLNSEPVYRKITLEMLSGFDTAKPGVQYITVTYGGCQTQYEIQVTTATITFLNADGTLLSQAEYMYGDKIIAPEIPEKPAGTDESYIFRGWGRAVALCEGEYTFQAIFGPEYILGDIDDNGVLDSNDVVQLLLHLTMPDMFILTMDADFTGDENHSVDDAIQLLLHITMPDLFPLLGSKST